MGVWGYVKIFTVILPWDLFDETCSFETLPVVGISTKNNSRVQFQIQPI